MKLYVLAAPEVPFKIQIVDEQDHNNDQLPMYMLYNDFLNNITSLLAKEPKIDEVLLFGPFNYIEGLGHQLVELIEQDIDITIMVDDDSTINKNITMQSTLTETDVINQILKDNNINLPQNAIVMPEGIIVPASDWTEEFIKNAEISD